MAKPRVFVSSTYYDLKHIRNSLESFIDTLGYEPILFERGDIAYTPEGPMEESCYREAGNVDLFVLIIGGRYGSPTSETAEPPKSTSDQYESITKREYQTAVSQNIPVYILIEQAVHAEYQTYCQNRDNDTIQYAQVESTNVFRMIDEIMAQRRNNPMHEFREYGDIEGWLREQWAGYFRELLRRAGQQQQLTSLSDQVSQLSVITGGLQTYMAALVRKAVPEEVQELEEQQRQQALLSAFSQNKYVRYLSNRGIAPGEVEAAMRATTTFEAFIDHLGSHAKSGDEASMRFSSEAVCDMQDARGSLGLPPFSDLKAAPKSASIPPLEGRPGRRQGPITTAATRSQGNTADPSEPAAERTIRSKKEDVS